MKKLLERLYNGVIKENPTFVLMLGMCPTLAVTTSAINGLGMGLSTMVVLALSNMLISALRKIIPDKVRIPAYIVIIATFVTVVELLLHAYLPGLYSALGIYISLIVVNCIILGRAESYASKNPVLPSLFDGIGMGLGFTLALTIIGLIREFLGAGTLFSVPTSSILGKPFGQILIGISDKIFAPGSEGFKGTMNEFLTRELGSFSPVGILVMAPGAFFVLATLTTIQNWLKDVGAKKGKDTSKIQSGCNFDCMNCKDSSCSRRLVDVTETVSDDTSKTVEVEESQSEEEKEALDKSDKKSKKKRKDKKNKKEEALNTEQSEETEESSTALDLAELEAEDPDDTESVATESSDLSDKEEASKDETQEGKEDVE